MNQARVLRLLLLTLVISVVAAVLVVMVSRSAWHVPLLSAAGPVASPAKPPAPVEVPALALPSLRPAQSSGDADPVLVGAGDIAGCDFDGDETTAKLLDRIDGTVFTLGDNVYSSGTARQFKNCYEPTWGRHKVRTRPTPGNHDYRTDDAAPYFDYFGMAAGKPGEGYYSYEIGAWHVIALNSNIDMDAGSAQVKWLRADLEAHPAACTLVYWHHPRWSSGVHGSDERLQAMWDTLYAAGVDVVLNGHDHNYERFAPQDPHGNADERTGIRQFVVGTGGKVERGMGDPIANSEVRNNGAFGVLKLVLRPTSYDWEFVPEPGSTFAEVGSGACH
jgi:acid phosphatase type 7